MEYQRAVPSELNAHQYIIYGEYKMNLLFDSIALYCAPEKGCFLTYDKYGSEKQDQSILFSCPISKNPLIDELLHTILTFWGDGINNNKLPLKFILPEKFTCLIHKETKPE